jgi:L-iditol 2-dehydrogenase
MKAYVLNAVGKLDYMDVDKPVLKDGEVLVEVKAAGICGSDIPRIYVNGTYHFPTIPGHEFSGIVRDVCDKSKEHLTGKRVGVFPLIPCFECSQCKAKKYEMCMHYDYLGSRRDGGFAEYVAVPERNLLELPDNVSFEAAAMLEPSCVGIHALKNVKLSEVRSAAVFGPGTIGILAAQWLRLSGVTEIHIIGTNDGQQNMVSKLQCGIFHNSHLSNPAEDVMNATGGEGVDVVLECTGYADVVNECLQVAKRGGDVILVGNPHGDVNMPRDIYWQILRKQLRLTGTWNSSFVPEDAEDDWRHTLKAIASGQLQPQRQITHKLPFDELHKGLEIMKNKSEYYNKIMIVK